MYKYIDFSNISLLSQVIHQIPNTQDIEYDYCIDISSDNVIGISNTNVKAKEYIMITSERLFADFTNSLLEDIEINPTVLNNIVLDYDSFREDWAIRKLFMDSNKSRHHGSEEYVDSNKYSNVKYSMYKYPLLQSVLLNSIDQYSKIYSNFMNDKIWIGEYSKWNNNKKKEILLFIKNARQQISYRKNVFSTIYIPKYAIFRYIINLAISGKKICVIGNFFDETMQTKTMRTFYNSKIKYKMSSVQNRRIIHKRYRVKYYKTIAGRIGRFYKIIKKNHRLNIHFKFIVTIKGKSINEPLARKILEYKIRYIPIQTKKDIRDKTIRLFLHNQMVDKELFSEYSYEKLFNEKSLHKQIIAIAKCEKEDFKSITMEE